MVELLDPVEAKARECVERGAALLDQKYPDWWMQVDLGRLSLANPCQCVLGQLGHDYNDGIACALGDDGMDSDERPFAYSSEFDYVTALLGWSDGIDKTESHGFDDDFCCHMAEVNPFDDEDRHDLSCDGVRTTYAALDKAWAEFITARRLSESLLPR